MVLYRLEIILPWVRSQWPTIQIQVLVLVMIDKGPVFRERGDGEELE